MFGDLVSLDYNVPAYSSVLNPQDYNIYTTDPPVYTLPDIMRPEPLPYGLGPNGAPTNTPFYPNGPGLGDISTSPLITTPPLNYQSPSTPNDPGFRDIIARILTALSRLNAERQGSQGQEQNQSFRGMATEAGAPRIGPLDVGSGSQRFLTPVEYARAGAADFGDFVKYLSRVSNVLYGPSRGSRFDAS